MTLETVLQQAAASGTTQPNIFLRPWVLACASVATLLGASIAIFQTVDAWRQKRLFLEQARLSQQQASDTKAISDTLRGVAEAISTKYLGNFPEYLRYINLILEDAESSIEVMCVVPQHGLVTSTAMATNFKHIIERKTIQGLSIRFVVSDSDHRHANRAAQYALLFSDPALETLNPHLEQGLINYLKGAKSSLKIEPPNKDAVLDFLTSEEADFVTWLKRHNGIEINEIPSVITYFCWIADYKRAIFAFKTGNFGAKGFFTSDAVLIQALRQSMDQT